MVERPPQPLVHVSVAVIDEEQLLLVQEKKPDVYGLWNLPGGHMERGESILEAARRELLEEAHISTPLESLVGIYSGLTSIRFVFRAQRAGQVISIGDDVMDVAYVNLEELGQWPQERLAGPSMLRIILRDIVIGRSYPLDQFAEQHRPSIEGPAQ